MAFNAWVTSNSLIDNVKRKISMPIAQGLMSDQDILDFAYEELLISQVPAVLSYHEEYFVWQVEVPLVPNKTRYSIPERAIGSKLRDIWYKDTSGNLFEMTRIAPDDKGHYRADSNGARLQKYYLQGNDVILTDSTIFQSTGSLQFEYFLRPNRLVPDERACYIESFLKEITFDNASLTAGDTIQIDSTVFTAGTDFAIGLTSTVTAANFVTALVAANIIVGATSSAAVATIEYQDINMNILSSNSNGAEIGSTQGMRFTSTVPSNIVAGLEIDFLQTRPGHSMRAMDVQIPANGVSSDQIWFEGSDVPTTLEVGDYVALAGEGIIPMIPTDLHTALEDRTCARILAAIGDQAGVDSINQKLSETEVRQGNILNNRIEGSLPKVVARHSLLRRGKIFSRRGY